MAQITLITGVPGDGKSLLAITKGLAFKAEGRTVYAEGFKELNYEETGFLPLPERFDSGDQSFGSDEYGSKPAWMLLENSVIIYDECYTVMPTRAAGRSVPLHISALARHRHYNIELVFVTQKHEQIDSFVRGLVKEHIHVKRRFGFPGAVLRTWSGFQSNTNATAESSPYWPYPKKNYNLYKSATAHTVKKKLPWYIWAPLPLLALMVGMLWYVKTSFMARGSAPATVAVATGGGAVPSFTGDGGKGRNDALRQSDYGAWLKPRVAGQPWTAPAYDQLQPQGVPDLFCIAVEDGRCECRTEQGTNYHMEAGICRSIAREGVYNPFRKPLDTQRGPQPREERREQPAQQPVASGASGYWPSGTIPQEYAPPEHTIVTRGAM